MAAVCQGGGVITVFVNGVLNPKDEVEASWETRHAELKDVFPASDHIDHVHNPTVAISADKAVSAIQKNSKFALGASLMAIGALVADTYMETGYAGKVLIATMETMQAKLQEQADKVSEKVAAELSEFLEKHPETQVVNLVAHSHGVGSFSCLVVVVVECTILKTFFLNKGLGDKKLY